METKQAVQQTAQIDQHIIFFKSKAMAETSSSGEETPPSTAGPSPPPKESEGKKELEARTKAVEKALSPLIEQVSVQETLQHRHRAGMTERKKSYYCTVVARAGVELSPTPLSAARET